MLGARYASLISNQSQTTNYMGYTPGGLAFTAMAGLTMPRTHAGVAPAINVGFHTDLVKAGAGAGSAFYFGSKGYLTFPNSVNNGIFLAPVWVHQATTTPYVVRGYMPGYWAPMHNRPLGNNDRFAGVGGMAGKSFEAFNTFTSGQVIIETSDTWS
jgi:hypothetical protein